MVNLDKKILYEQLDNFQILRHDFLNYFQVIKGYLQLNMPDKALAYIDEVLVEIRPQQDIYKIGQKTLLGILLGWYFKLRLKGAEFMLDFPPEMKNEEFWLDHWQEEYALSFSGYTKDCLDLFVQGDQDVETLTAKIRFGVVGGGFSCEFRLYKEDNLFEQNVYSPVYQKA